MEKPLVKKLSQALAALLCCAVLFTGCAFGRPDSSASGSSTSGASTPGSEAGGSDTGGEAEYSIYGEDGVTLYRPPKEPMALSACLMNTETGIVVYEKDADMQLPAASLVKMMTCILVMEQVEKFGWDLDATLVDSSNKTWIYDSLYGKNASTADIRQGEVLPLRELLYATLLPSGNEAALLLADFACTGYMANFLYMMNMRARTLGCTGTYFADCNGLSEESVTTARDMALIVQAFMKHPLLVEIVGTGSFEIQAHERHTNPYYVHTTNRLIVTSSPYYKLMGSSAGSLLGGKTGSLGEWQNFASMASRNGESYVCVVMQSPDAADYVAPTIEGETPAKPRPALVESAELYAWAFEALEVRSALDITQPVTELRVRYSTEADTVKLLPSGDIKAVLPKDASEAMIRRVYDLPAEVQAPVRADTVMGSVTLSVGGVTIGSAQLIAERDIERNGTLFMLSEVGGFFRSTYFRVVVVLVFLAAVVYGCAFVLVASSRSRKKRQAPVESPFVEDMPRPARKGGGAAPKPNSRRRTPPKRPPTERTKP